MKPAEVIKLHNDICPWPFCSQLIDLATAKTKGGWNYCGEHRPGLKPLQRSGYCCRCGKLIPKGKEALMLPDSNSLNEYGEYTRWFVLHPRGECRAATTEGVEQMSQNTEDEKTRVSKVGMGAKTQELVDPKGFAHMESESRRIMECILPLIDRFGMVGGGHEVFEKYLSTLQEVANTDRTAGALYNLWRKYCRNLKGVPSSTVGRGVMKPTERWTPDQEDRLLRYVSVALGGTGRSPNQSWFRVHMGSINEIIERHTNASSLTQKWNKIAKARPDDVNTALRGCAWEPSSSQKPSLKEPLPVVASKPKPKPNEAEIMPLQPNNTSSGLPMEIVETMAQLLEGQHPLLPYAVSLLRDGDLRAGDAILQALKPLREAGSGR